jgi:anti-sigma B factor antagonist
MPDGPDPGLLVVEVDRPAPAAVTVEVLGELDLATAPALQERLESLLDTGVQDVILDLRGVPFCDVPGLNALLRVQTQLASRGGRLSVVGPPRTLRVTAAVLGLTECLHLMPAPGADSADPADRADEDGAGTT